MSTSMVRNPWIATSVVITGTVLAVLDSTIINVALHQISVSLDAKTGIEWVATAYFLAVCAAQPATGWIADRVGRKRVFLIGLSAFVAGSVGCALSPNLQILVLFRVVQGLGGGAVAPMAATMVIELFPKERHGRAMAISTMAFMMTPAIGPTVGGLIVTNTSWRWMFIVNVPIGLAAVAAGIFLIPEFGHRERRRFDVPGSILGTGGLTLTVMGLAEGNTWGWTSVATIGSLLGGVVMLVVFCRVELRSSSPMLELRILSHRPFRLAMMASGLMTMAQFGRLVFIPLELESLRGYSALRVGLLLAPPAFAGMATTWYSGRMADRMGPRKPVMIGCAMGSAALVGMATLTLHSHLLVIQLLLIVQSAGMGFILTPAAIAGLSELPARLLAQGSALRSLSSQASGALAIGLFGAVVASRKGINPTPAHAQAAYNSAFLVAAAGGVLAFWLGSRLPSRHSRDIEHNTELDAALMMPVE